MGLTAKLFADLIRIVDIQRNMYQHLKNATLRTPLQRQEKYGSFFLLFMKNMCSF